MATVIKKRQRAGTTGSGSSKPWTVRYQHQGKQRERSFATKREADDFKAEFERQSRVNLFVDPRNGSTDFTEYARRWIDGIAVLRAPTRARSFEIIGDWLGFS